jgi:Cft2 family RNA processing exonuclease
VPVEVSYKENEYFYTGYLDTYNVSVHLVPHPTNWWTPYGKDVATSFDPRRVRTYSSGQIYSHTFTLTAPQGLGNYDVYVTCNTDNQAQDFLGWGPTHVGASTEEWNTLNWSIPLPGFTTVISPGYLSVGVDGLANGANIFVDGNSVTVPEGQYPEIQLSVGQHTVDAQNVVPLSQGVQGVFSGWSDGVTANERTINFNGTGLRITAHYSTQFYLQVDSNYGTVQGTGWYDANTDAAFSASTPAFLDPHVLDHWGGAYSGTSTTGTVLMNGPKEVSAVYRTDYSRILSLLALLTTVGLVFVGVRKAKHRKQIRQSSNVAVYQLPEQPPTDLAYWKGVALEERRRSQDAEEKLQGEESEIKRIRQDYELRLSGVKRELLETRDLLSGQNKELKGELSASRTREDNLRIRISELEADLDTSDAGVDFWVDRFTKLLFSEDFKAVALGSGHEIGGSCILVRVAGHHFILDCGGYNEEPAPYLSLLKRIKGRVKIAAIFISHAHNDHIGEFLQVKEIFPDTPVYATAPTKRLAPIVLSDRLNFLNHGKLRSQVDRLEVIFKVEEAVETINTLEYNKPTPIPGAPGVTVEFRNAGHIIGSAYIILRGATNETIIYTGDFNVVDCTTTDGAQNLTAEPRSLIISEATYSTKLEDDENRPEQELVIQAILNLEKSHGRPSRDPEPNELRFFAEQMKLVPVAYETLIGGVLAWWRKTYTDASAEKGEVPKWTGKFGKLLLDADPDRELDPIQEAGLARQYNISRFIKRIEQTIDRKGVVLIPVFALGKGQEIAYTINDAINGTNACLPKNLEVVLLGKMLASVTNLVEGELHDYLPEKTRQLKLGDNFRIYPEANIDEILQQRPVVILATPGMVKKDKDRGSYNITRKIGSDKNSAILIVGYQGDSDSEGNYVVKKAFPNAECDVGKFSFSGHSGAMQVTSFIHRFDPGTVMVVHGDHWSVIQMKDRFPVEGVAPMNLEVVKAGNKTVENPILLRGIQPVRELNIRYTGSRIGWKDEFVEVIMGALRNVKVSKEYKYLQMSAPSITEGSSEKLIRLRLKATRGEIAQLRGRLRHNEFDIMREDEDPGYILDLLHRDDRNIFRILWLSEGASMKETDKAKVDFFIEYPARDYPELAQALDDAIERLKRDNLLGKELQREAPNIA